MDTKTAKTEALYILSVIERGSTDAEFLGEARHKFYDLMKAQGCNRRDYLDSTDACLTLRLPEPYSWSLEYGSKNIYAKVMKNDLDDIYATEVVKWGKTLPLAILAAWWTMQD